MSQQMIYNDADVRVYIERPPLAALAEQQPEQPAEPDRSGPARREDMEAFAAELQADPAKAQEFFESAGILGPDGKLTAPYRPETVEPARAPVAWIAPSAIQSDGADCRPVVQDYIASGGYGISRGIATGRGWLPLYLAPPASDALDALRAARDEACGEVRNLAVGLARTRAERDAALDALRELLAVYDDTHASNKWVDRYLDAMCRVRVVLAASKEPTK